MTPDQDPHQLGTTLAELLKDAGTAMIIGIGNEFMGDDGAGIRLVRMLMDDAELKERDDIRLIDAGTTLINHLDTIAAERPGLLLLMDCVEFIGPEEREEGETPSFGFYSLQDESLQHVIPRSFSTHQLPLDFITGFVTKFVKETRMYLLAIGFEDLDHTEELRLSPSVDRNVDALYALLKEALLGS